MKKILNILQEFLEIFLKLIYPNVCGICGKINKECLCKKCTIKLKEYELKNKIKRKNKLNSIQKNEIYFDELFSIYRYEGLLRDIIIRYKFQDKSYLYKTFSKIILNNEKICGFFKKYDIIIPVPIHKNKLNKRGYNQTQLIAREIANKLNIKLEDNVLVKIKNTRPQSELTKKERIDNIKDAFIIINNKKAKDKNILIFDDIYTTGSTANECAKVLKENGANRIGVFTIAKD